MLRRSVTETTRPVGATLQLLPEARDKMGLPAAAPAGTNTTGGSAAEPDSKTGFRLAAARCRALLLARIPIIALTADADSDGAHRCLEAGVNIHLEQPVIREKAVQAIESLQILTPAVSSTQPNTAN